MKLATTKEIAEYLQLSEAAIYRLIKKGSIPVIYIGGTYRFSYEAINNWLANGGTDGRKK